MSTEIDESWVEQAIDAHRHVRQLHAELAGWLDAAQVSVHSPDELVQVQVRPDGSISRVTLTEAGPGPAGAELAQAIAATVAAAADAARWARRTLYAELAARHPPPPPSV